MKSLKPYLESIMKKKYIYKIKEPVNLGSQLLLFTSNQNLISIISFKFN